MKIKISQIVSVIKKVIAIVVITVWKNLQLVIMIVIITIFTTVICNCNDDI